MSELPQTITIAALANLLRRWPRRGAGNQPCLLLIADRYSGLAVPAVAAAALESDDGGGHHLVIHPEQGALDPGSHDPNATAIDLALAALQYRMNTPLDQADPQIENHLLIRAVDALIELKKAMRITL